MDTSSRIRQRWKTSKRNWLFPFSCSEHRTKAIFDRCPLDLIAYMSAHSEAAAFDVEHWRPRAQRALQTLNLLVFVPIEEYDRVMLASAELQDHAREEVDEVLRELLLSGPTRARYRGSRGRGSNRRQG